MDLAALVRASKALESSLDRLEFWLAVFTFLVVVGLVLEYWHQAIEFWEHFRWPMAMFPREKFMGILGGVLVTIGVFGEVAIQVKASRIETKLREHNHQIEALLQNKASENEREARQLDKEAEDERNARVLIEESLAGRILTPKDIDSLSGRMSRFKGRQTVWVGFRNGDAEAEIFAWDIAKALHEAKWKVNSPGGTIIMARLGLPYNAQTSTSFRTGIDVTSTEKYLAVARALGAALRGLGFDAQAGAVSHPLSEDRMDVFIWARPRGPQGEAKLKLEAKKQQAQTSQTTK